MGIKAPRSTGLRIRDGSPPLTMLTSTLTPSSARALICCSVAVTGLSGVFWTGDSCDGSSASAGVSEVDLRGGMLVAGPVARVRIFDYQLRCNGEDELVMRVVWRWSACQERGKKKVAETRREWEIGDSRCGDLAAALIVGRYGRILFGLSICLV